MKKVVVLDSLAVKELDSFSIEVRARFNDLFEKSGHNFICISKENTENAKKRANKSA